jgi:hypothetical protein
VASLFAKLTSCAKLAVKFHHDGVIDDQADRENKTEAEQGKDGKGSEESRPREGRVGYPSRSRP